MACPRGIAKHGADVSEGRNVLVVLAGGAGTRMGPWGDAFPKAAMHAFDEPLLIRLIRQAESAGFCPMVSSTPRGCVALRETLRAFDRESVPVLDNPDHVFGPLEALSFALEITGPYALVSLGDTYFLDNPFQAFTGMDAKTDCAGVSPTAGMYDHEATASVRVDNEYILEVNESKTVRSNTQWCGLLRFATDVTNDVRSFTTMFGSGCALGAFMHHRIGRGHPLRAIACPDVINVNEPIDLLAASLYAASERFPEASATLQAAASGCRNTKRDRSREYSRSRRGIGKLPDSDN